MPMRIAAIAAALTVSGAAIALEPAIDHGPSSTPAAVAASQISVSANGNVQSDENLAPEEEVTVEAHRRKLAALKLRINNAVDAFYDAFNKANTVAGFETSCSDERVEGSYVRHHICTPAFVQEARDQEVQGFFDNYATAPAGALIFLRMRTYKKHIQELIHTDPNVRQAAAAFDALEWQYASVNREKIKAN